MKNLVLKKWMLSLAFLFMFMSGSFATNYVVSGGSDPTYDGTYIENGMNEGKKMYTCIKGSESYFILWEEGIHVWSIGFYSGYNFFAVYRSDIHDNTPPPTGWVHYAEFTPVPTVEVDGKSLAYSSQFFREDDLNNGSISTVITITNNNYAGETFTGTDDENFVVTGKVIVSNVPAGLTATVVRKSDLTVEFKLNGNATNHTNANDISNLTIAFQNSAFSGDNASEVYQSSLNNLAVDFIQIFTVASSGGNYTSIQAAINAAADNDIISLAAEVFTERITIEKSLKIKGQGAKVSIIQAAATPYSADGRVIYSWGAQFIITLEDLTIRNGYQTNYDLGTGAYGGGIFSMGTINVNRCAIVNNCLKNTNYYSDLYGGAIYADYLNIRDSYIGGNSLFSWVSCIYGSMGGGIHAATLLLMTNCTVADNSALGGCIPGKTYGGGIWTLNGTIINSTFTTNSAGEGSGIYVDQNCTIKNSISFGNWNQGSSNDFAVLSAAYAYNSILGDYGRGIGGELIFTVSENVTSNDPLLVAPADNGGQTFTCAIQTGSPAINAGMTGTDIPATDQRGLSPNGIHDIGAFEYNGLTPAPEIDVKQSSTAIVDGSGSYDFGSQTTSTNTDIVFTIENTGTATSTLGSFSITGTNANQFTFQGTNPTTVAASGTATYTVRFTPTSAGAKTATISFANQDANENPYDFTITGTGTAPEIDVKQSSTAIADGSGSYDFGSQTTSTNTDIVFTIENTGTATSTLGSFSITGTNANQFTFQGTNPTTVAASGTATYTVRFTPTSTGAKTATVSFANQDANENPYDFTITGTGTAPEIDVKQSSTAIADGSGSYDFGSQTTSTNTDIVFTIENTGTATSTLGSFSITGTNANQFSLQGTNPTTVAASGTATYTVRFTPTSAGAKTATVSFANQDPNENPYNFTISGTGALPTFTISGNVGVAGATLSYTDGTAKTATSNSSGDYSFTVTTGWTGTVTPGKTDYTFTPSNTGYTNVTSNQTAQNYSAIVTYIWTGTVSTNWNTSGNWNRDIVPSATDHAIIPSAGITNFPVVNEVAASPAVCYHLSIYSGAVVTVAAAKALTVYGNLVNNAGVDGLVLQSDYSGNSTDGWVNNSGSLIVYGSLTGPGTVDRAMNSNRWYLLSPPANEKVGDFIYRNKNIPYWQINIGDPKTPTDPYAMRLYNTVGNNWATYFSDINLGEGGIYANKMLGVGTGYLIRSAELGTPQPPAKLTFKGALNVGTKTVKMDRLLLKSWNCIGNPYTSAICLNDPANATNNFLSINVDATDNTKAIDKNFAAIYFWNPEIAILGKRGVYYEVINQESAAAYAQVGQGFFVRGNFQDAEVNFTSAMQVHKPDLILKATSAPRPTIQLIASNDQAVTFTTVKFIQGMSKGLDVGYDAGIFKADPDFSLYTKLVEDNGVEFQLQCLPTDQYNKMVIPIGIDCKAGGEIVFSVQAVQLDPTCKVILEDKLTNTFTDLSKGSYKAAVAANTIGTGRFFLHTGDIISGLEDQELSDGRLTAYARDNKEIRVIGEVSEGAVATLVNGLGQVVLTKKLGAGSLNIIGLPNLSSGLYLLNINDKGTPQTIKVMIRK